MEMELKRISSRTIVVWYLSLVLQSLLVVLENSNELSNEFGAGFKLSHSFEIRPKSIQIPRYDVSIRNASKMCFCFHDLSFASIFSLLHVYVPRRKHLSLFTFLTLYSDIPF